MADFLRDVLSFAMCTLCLYKASSEHRKERCPRKIKKSQRFELTHSKKKTVMLHVAFATGLLCLCTASPGARSAVGYAHGSCGGVTGRTQETPPWNCINGKKTKEAIMPNTQKSIYQVFSNELSKQTPSSWSSVLGFVCVGNGDFFCTSLCIPVPASTSQSHQQSQPALGSAQESFNQRLSAVMETSVRLRLSRRIVWCGTNPCKNIWAGH